MHAYKIIPEKHVKLRRKAEKACDRLYGYVYNVNFPPEQQYQEFLETQEAICAELEAATTACGLSLFDNPDCCRKCSRYGIDC